MIMYPAIDMLDGQAVRLRQGRREEAVVYGDPRELAARRKAEGAGWLHLVDLGAAFGEAPALALIRDCAVAFGGPVELGGGLRDMKTLAAALDAGVTRCIIGTAAVERPELVAEACREWPGRIAVGIDAKNGEVMLRGWVRGSAVKAAELALRMRDLGVETVIYTDISRDGMLSGPNVPATAELVRATGMQVVGSGGVSSLEDLRQLRSAGCAGAILGKALYEGAFTLAEALAV